MKAVIVCKEPFPNGMAATHRIQCYAKALIAGGIDCRVVIFSRTENRRSPRNPEPFGIFEGIPFLYIGSNPFKPSHKIPRLMAEASDRRALLRYLKNNLDTGDVVIGYVNADTDFMCSVIDTVHSNGAKYIRELCEIPFFGDESDSAKVGLHKILDKLFPKCDGFLTISEPLTRMAERHKSPSAGILKVPILVDYPAGEIPDEPSEDAYIFHGGTLYEQKDGILGMIEAVSLAGKLSGRPIRLIFTGTPGESPDGEKITETVRRCGMQDFVEFRGYLGDEERRRCLKGALAVILNKHNNPQNVNGFSTKLAEYLAAGKAVILTDVGEAPVWLKDGESAVVVPPDDIQELANAVQKLMSDPQLRKKVGEGGRRVCRENFDWRSVSDRLCRFVSSL